MNDVILAWFAMVVIVACAVYYVTHTDEDDF